MTFRGVVLTGGASRRMGTDKALVEVGGVALAVRVAAALTGAGCDPVVCQGGDAAALGALGLIVVPDAHPGGGPVTAIVDALAAASPAGIVVSACDLPGLDAATVATLVRVADAHPDADVVVACDDRGPHLLGVWRSRSRAGLAGLVTDGVQSYRVAIERLGAVTVSVPASVVVNANSPEDLR